MFMKREIFLIVIILSLVFVGANNVIFKGGNIYGGLSSDYILNAPWLKEESLWSFSFNSTGDSRWVKIGDVQASHVWSSGSGFIYYSDRVGIGISNPSEKVEIGGNIKINGDLILSGGILQEDEKSCSLEPGWSNYDGSFGPCIYHKDKNGYVHLSGAVRGSGTNLFYLQEGYRPDYTMVFPVITNTENTVCQIRISSSGRVADASDTGCGSIINLDGIVFRAI